MKTALLTPDDAPEPDAAVSLAVNDTQTRNAALTLHQHRVSTGPPPVPAPPPRDAP